MSKSRVAIICGGKSSEHEISCVSANGILQSSAVAKAANMKSPVFQQMES